MGKRILKWTFAYAVERGCGGQAGAAFYFSSPNSQRTIACWCPVCQFITFYIIQRVSCFSTQPSAHTYDSKCPSNLLSHTMGSFTVQEINQNARTLVTAVGNQLTEPPPPKDTNEASVPGDVDYDVFTSCGELIELKEETKQTEVYACLFLLP